MRIPLIVALIVAASPVLGMNFGSKALTGAGLFAYGDSITVGAAASTQANAYASLLAAKLGPLSNNAISGTGTASAAKTAMATLPLGRRPAVTVMSGFNDILRNGAGSYDKIKANTRALIAASLLKENVPASALRKSGTWVSYGSSDGGRAIAIGGTGLYSTDPNAYLEWDFFGETLVVGGFTTNAVGGTYKDFNVSIDGGVPTIFAAFGMTDEAYPTTGLNALVLQNLGFAKHTVRLSQKAGPGAYIVVDYVGTLAEPGATGSTFVGQIPGMTNWSYNGLTINQGILDGANAAIADTVAEFVGWPVALVPVNDFYTPDSTHTAADGQHPTDAGHAQIATAFWSRMSPHY